MDGKLIYIPNDDKQNDNEMNFYDKILQNFRPVNLAFTPFTKDRIEVLNL